MHRNGVAGEGVDREHVEALRLFALQTEPSIAERGFHGGIAVSDIAEIPIGDSDYRRIDVVEPVKVALAPIDRKRASSQPDHTDPQRCNARMQ